MPDNASNGGAEPTADHQLALVYAELRRVAGAYMRRERAAHTLQPTALVNEAYLRLAKLPDFENATRSQVLAYAARNMRQILVDHARARNASKRQGGRQRLTLVDDVVGIDGPEVDVLDLHAGLEALAALDPRKVRVVELRFFAGLTTREVASVLGISNTTAEDDWYMARAWLKRRLRA